MAKRQAKRRDPGRDAGPQRSPAPRGAKRPAAQPAPPPRAAARLGHPLRRAESTAISVIAVAGLVAFAGFFDAFDFYDDNPLVAVALTFILLGCVFSIERRAIAATTRASFRFAGAGIVMPALWWIVPYAAMTPIGAMQGYSTYRLGVGSVFGPSFVGAILTGTIFGPTAGMLSCTASTFGGMAALLFTRTGR